MSMTVKKIIPNFGRQTGEQSIRFPFTPGRGTKGTGCVCVWVRKSREQTSQIICLSLVNAIPPVSVKERNIMGFSLPAARYLIFKEFGDFSPAL